MPDPRIPAVTTLVALLRWRAQHQPDAPAYTFLADGFDAETTWTWSDVDRRARAVAAWLQARNARGERAMLMFEEGLDYLAALYGCIYAAALACPSHPPDPNRLQRTLPRLQEIARDAGIRYVLTSRRLLDGAKGNLVDSPTLSGAEWVAVDEIDDAMAANWVDPGVGPNDLAYLQYTSGSTSTPKGVMVSHHNLIHQLTDFDLGYAHDADSVIVSWLPATHDLGLVYGRMMPAFVGIRCVFMPPGAFMRRPLAWMRAMHVWGGSHSPSPNFGFEVAASKVDDADVAALDLSRVKVLLNGAEAIRRSSEERFIAKYTPAGLRRSAVTHAMGMSEATAKVMTEPIERHPARFLAVDAKAYERNEVVVRPLGDDAAFEVASNGTTHMDTVCVIADPATRADLGEDRVGELWVSGSTVAQGYWNNPEATEASFRARLTNGRGPFLRTGDLAFIHDGEIYLTGRLKELIIIRGQNHYPQDIEWSVQSAHPSLRPNCAAAFSIRGPSGLEELVLVSEIYPDRVTDPEAVFGALRSKLAENHALTARSIVLIAPRALPKTSSGKIQRGRARTQFESGELDAVHRWDRPSSGAVASPAPNAHRLRAELRELTPRRRTRRLVETIQGLAATLLGLDADDVEEDRPLSELGLDSVTAVEMVESVGRLLGAPVPGTVLFDYPTIEDLSRYLLDDVIDLSEPAAPSTPAAAAHSEAEVAAMSDDEVTAALLAELEGL
ncbi:MAG: acyl-CoA synthetase (AMP-forming)/AMP-acid ligase II/acyl carrier protein [Myxococcota bacterium]|jgi:acyl-CoA synthetase (AMP-forming)/AMP-acid ligase II/acyl carrier protein